MFLDFDQHTLVLCSPVGTADRYIGQQQWPPALLSITNIINIPLRPNKHPVGKEFFVSKARWKTSYFLPNNQICDV